jgi:hypothetical protein
VERPERYAEPSRFDTMPSQPSLQACSKMMPPSPTFEIETSQIHRIHPNIPAATMMGIGLMWDFQKRIVHAAVIA